MTDIIERLKYQSGWDERSQYMGKTGEMLWDAIEEMQRLRAALKQINEIELEEYGPDYAEIEKAQVIAAAALAHD